MTLPLFEVYGFLNCVLINEERIVKNVDRYGRGLIRGAIGEVAGTN
jgi:hypothetical protein